jgi:hypothetical protein
MNNDSRSSSESEDLVVAVTKRRWNEAERRLEWLVTWQDGANTWEPKDSFIEEDGPVNEVWLEFEENAAQPGSCSCKSSSLTPQSKRERGRAGTTRTSPKSINLTQIAAKKRTDTTTKLPVYLLHCLPQKEQAMLKTV